MAIVQYSPEAYKTVFDLVDRLGPLSTYALEWEVYYAPGSEALGALGLDSADRPALSEIVRDLTFEGTLKTFPDGIDLGPVSLETAIGNMAARGLVAAS